MGLEFIVLSLYMAWCLKFVLSSLSAARVMSSHAVRVTQFLLQSLAIQRLFYADIACASSTVHQWQTQTLAKSGNMENVGSGRQNILLRNECPPCGLIIYYSDSMKAS